MLKAMVARGICPECECFDTGILRSIRMFDDVGMFGDQPIHVSLVMGVASGMPPKVSTGARRCRWRSTHTRMFPGRV